MTVKAEVTDKARDQAKKAWKYINSTNKSTRTDEVVTKIPSVVCTYLYYLINAFIFILYQCFTIIVRIYDFIINFLEVFRGEIGKCGNHQRYLELQLHLLLFMGLIIEYVILFCSSNTLYLDKFYSFLY